MTDNPEALTVRYTNWRGETRTRTIIPNGNLRFGTSEWHPEPTWLLSCHEGEIVHGGWREFELSKCDFLTFDATDLAAERDALREALEVAEGAIDAALPLTDEPTSGQAWRLYNALVAVRAALSGAKP